MEEEWDFAGIPRSAGSDPSGSCSGFKLSAKLRARMEKLSKWRINPSSIKAPKDACQFHGGHATVSKAFLLSDKRRWADESYWNPKEVLQLCRQSSESGEHIRRAADNRQDAEGGLGDEEEDGEQEDGFDRYSRWQGEFVAVKKSRIGDNKDLERVLGLVLRETEFLVELSHPNIVKLEGFVEDLSKDIIWLVLPWADNGNLKDFVASQDWEIPERISLINDVAKGLEYLHSRNPPICHGDLKSFNALVNSEYRAVITDFGSARLLKERDLNRHRRPVQDQQQPVQAKFCTLSKTITLTGNIYTLRWAAPELLYDDQMGLWSDIWALGWIAYEVLTNSIPFQDVPADAVVIERVIKGDLPSINEHARVSLFENLCSLMTLCWNNNPSERPTAKDYRHAISNLPMVVPDRPDSTIFFAPSAEVLMHRGRRGWKSGDSAMALVCFTEAHRIYVKNNHEEGKANARRCLAELHLSRKEYNEASAHYSEALQISIDINDRTGKADALWGLAEVHRLRNEYSEAIALYSKARQIHGDIGDMEGQASALWGLAEAYRLRSEYNEAITLLSDGSQIYIDDRRGRASALFGLAEVHRLQNKYSQAIERYSQVLEIRTDIGDRTGQAAALSGLAQVHQIRKEYSKANKFYAEALQIRPDIDDSRSRAESLSSLAQVHRTQKEYSKAIKLYSEALQIHTEISHRTRQASTLSTLAQLYQLQMEYSKAIKLYSEALQIRPDIRDSRGKASALWSLAEVHRLREEHSEAILLYLEALQTHTGDNRNRRSGLPRGRSHRATQD